MSKNVPGHENLIPVPSENLLTNDEIPSAQFVKLVSSNKMKSLLDFDIDAAITNPVELFSNPQHERTKAFLSKVL